MIVELPPPSHASLAAEPEPMTCEGCGSVWRWVWYAPGKGRLPSRWCAPKVSPCTNCAPSADSGAAAERELRDRLARAGIPRALWRMRLHDAVLQGRAEPPDAFRARVAREGRLGAATANAPLLAKIDGWRPHERWLVLTGPPGTGKTTLAAALAAKLLARPAERWEGEAGPCRPGGRTLTRRACTAVAYHDIGDLVERESLKLRGLDPHPTVDVAKVPGVLILDELGARRPTSGEMRLVQRIVMHRARYRLPLVLISNHDDGGIVDAYGDAVASRIGEALTLTLGGDDWRASW